MEPSRYKNPPIEEAVCDFQFAPGTDWDPTMPGRIYELLMNVYNEKPRSQQLVEAQFRGGDSEGNPSVSVQHRLGGHRVQLLAEKGTRIVGIGPDQLTVHMLRPYEGWEAFRPKIHEALAAYLKIAHPEGVTRLGLRYINRIMIGKIDPDLAEYFTIPPRFPPADPPLKRLSFFNRKEAEFQDKPIRIVVTFADMDPGLPEVNSYLLDIDILSIRTESPISLEEVKDVLDDMKIRHRQIFETLITDESRKLFNA